jgi:hypothetical protein
VEGLSGEVEQFAFREAEWRAQSLENRFLAAERGAEAEGNVWKSSNMFNFFSGKHHRQWIILIHIAGKPGNRFAIDSASD